MSAAAKKKAPARKRSARSRKKDLVFGIGATGLSVARYLDRTKSNAIFADSREQPPGLSELAEISPDAEVLTGETDDKVLKNVSRVIASPGVSDSEPLLKAARKKKIPVVSDIELFVEEASAPIVAVTGSNGKSTVTTLLKLMCDAAGIDAAAGGNLGVPALDLLAEDEPAFYVLELSSFQLQRTNKLPTKVSVLLNISPDHLDWHESEKQYRKAKYRILDEAEAAVVNRDEKDVLNHIASDTPHYSFGLDTPDDNGFGISEEDGEQFLARGKQALLACNDVAMMGAHNLANALAALAAGEFMGLPLPAMLQVLNEFPGLPHRMQVVGRHGGAVFVNDSKATNVGAAIAAVNSVAGPVILIAGGQGKGGDFDLLAKSVMASVHRAILIGEDAPLLEESFSGLVKCERANDLDAAVQRAAEIAQPGDTVLLAPACASFDQFENYQVRGDEFRRAVGAISS